MGVLIIVTAVSQRLRHPPPSPAQPQALFFDGDNIQQDHDYNHYDHHEDCLDDRGDDRRDDYRDDHYGCRNDDDNQYDHHEDYLDDRRDDPPDDYSDDHYDNDLKNAHHNDSRTHHDWGSNNHLSRDGLHAYHRPTS